MKTFTKKNFVQSLKNIPFSRYHGPLSASFPKQFIGPLSEKESYLAMVLEICYGSKSR